MRSVRSLLIVACLLAGALPLASGAALAGIGIAASFNPGLAFNIPSSTPTKFPHIAAVNGRVAVSGRDGDTVHGWVKNDRDASFPSPASIGSTSGKPQYGSTAVASTPDGSFYYAWVDNLGPVYMRRQLPDGTLGPVRTVVAGGSRSAVSIGVIPTRAGLPQGRIFVVWNEDFRIRFRTSIDGGASWTSTAVVSSRPPYGGQYPPAIDADSDGHAVVTFNDSTGNIVGAFWSNGGFNSVIVDPNTGAFNANSTVAVSPDGYAYFAWRKENSGANYAKFKLDGTLVGKSRVTTSVDNKVQYAVGVDADANGNVHIFWISQISGTYDFYYVFIPKGGAPESLVRIPNSQFNVSARGVASSSAGRIYANAVSEVFTKAGADPSVRYYRLDGPPGELNGSTEPGVTPSFTSAAASTSVGLKLSNPTGSANSVRWRWGQAPTDSANDSGGWQAIDTAKTYSVTLPKVGSNCQQLALYVQAKSDSAVQDTTRITPITVTADQAIQATVEATNPYLASLPKSYTFSSAAAAPVGAWDGDPGYTRELNFVLKIDGSGEASCAGLLNFSVTGTNAQPISNNYYLNKLTLPGDQTKSDHQFSVAVNDKLGNGINQGFALIYDAPDLPTAGAGLPVVTSATVTGDGKNRIMQELSLSNVAVTDNLYGQKEKLPSNKSFWGVWVATSTDGTPPADPTRWTAIHVADPTQSTIKVTYNLFNGLSYTDFMNHPGKYYVHVRFLDGAGNPSAVATIKTATVTLTAGYEVPKLMLPAIRR